MSHISLKRCLQFKSHVFGYFQKVVMINEAGVHTLTSLHDAVSLESRCEAEVTTLLAGAS